MIILFHDSDLYSSGFRHGRTGQPPGASFFRDTLGAAARADKQKILCVAKRFFVIYIISLCVELANWRSLQLPAPLLAENIHWSFVLWEKCKGVGREARATFHLWVSLKWNGQGGGGRGRGIHTSNIINNRLKSVTHLDFLPNNAHFIHNVIIQAYSSCKWN